MVVKFFKMVKSKAMNLKNQLRYYLKAYGLTAAELSRRSSVPKQSISDWLGGVIPRSLPHLKSVSDTFGVTIDELCYGDISLDSADACAPIKSSNDSQEIWMTGFFEGKVRKINIDEFNRRRAQPQASEPPLVEISET